MPVSFAHHPLPVVTHSGTYRRTAAGDIPFVRGPESVARKMAIKRRKRYQTAPVFTSLLTIAAGSFNVAGGGFQDSLT